MKRAHRGTAMVLACTMTLLACNSNSSTSPNLTARYALQSADGLTLPVLVMLATDSVRLRADTSFLYDNNTWKENIVQDVTVNGSRVTRHLTNTGRYSQTGNSLAFTGFPPDTTFTAATLSDGTLTIIQDNLVNGARVILSISDGTTTLTTGNTIILVFHQL